jgi:predicted DNA-binding transcriptional regulator AlpA
MNSRQNCIRNGKIRRKETLQRAHDGIELLKKNKKPITLKSVASVSGVSLSWFYKNPKVKAYIESLGNSIELTEEEFPKVAQYLVQKVGHLENCINEILFIHQKQ